MNLTKKLTTTLIGSKSQSPEFGLKKQATTSPMRNKDLDELNKTNSYGYTQIEMDEIILDLVIVQQQYDKFASEDDSLSGVLNVKLTKLKNADFRLKLESWKNRKGERKNVKKKKFEHGKSLRADMEK
jgi:hypothetical protein